MLDNSEKRLAEAGVKVLLGCGGGTCPTIYEDKAGNLLIQGYVLKSEEKTVFELPEMEDVVRIPKQLILDLASKL